MEHIGPVGHAGEAGAHHGSVTPVVVVEVQSRHLICEPATDQRQRSELLRRAQPEWVRADPRVHERLEPGTEEDLVQVTSLLVLDLLGEDLDVVLGSEHARE
jgi:hypothetical protein